MYARARQTGTQGFSIFIDLAVISRYLTFAWVTPFMHVLATVGNKGSNYWKYGILRCFTRFTKSWVGQVALRSPINRHALDLTVSLDDQGQ